MKLVEHALKIVERVLERIRELVNIDLMQFGFMPGRGATDALFVVRRIQKEYRDNKKKLYKCFVHIEKTFDRIPRKVMSLYHGAKTKVRVGSELSQEFLKQTDF